MALTQIDDRGLKTPVDLLDNEKIRLGTGNDLQIYHTGSYSLIDDAGSGALAIRSNNAVDIKDSDDVMMAAFNKDADVKLYYDGATKFVTTNTGATVSGTIVTDAIDMEDNAKIYLGAGDDLQIYHNGSSGNYIDSYNKDLYLRCNLDPAITGGDIILQPKSGENSAVFRDNGAVELYYDNVKKFETTSNGVKLTGSGNVLELDGGNAIFTLQLKETSSAYHRLGFQKSGHLLQLGEFNNAGDSFTEILQVNASDDTFGGEDNIKLNLGTGDDLQIYHDGSNSYIKDTGTGVLVINGSEIHINSADNSDNCATFVSDGAAKLHYDGSVRLETTSSGVNLGGNLSTDSGGAFTLNAGGASGTAANIILRCAAENAIIANANSGVDLYYDNAKKFWTEDTGVCVQDSGTVQIKMQSDGGSIRGYFYADTNDYIGILDNTGNWRLRCTTSGYELYGTNHSDKDLKDNITAITGTSLDKITKLVPKSFNWKATDDGKTDTTQTYVGFIAQDVKEHFPSLVTGTDGNKDMGLDYRGLFSHAIKALTELSTEVDTLKTKVAALEAA